MRRCGPALLLAGLLACTREAPPPAASSPAPAAPPASAVASAAAPASAAPPAAVTLAPADGGKPQDDDVPDIEYVPTPDNVVAKMLEVAKVKKGDVLYDLGCGDGRIVVTAAKKLGVRGFGFDIDPERIKESNENARKNGVESLVRFERKNIFEVDLSPATVVTLYLLPELNVRLIPQLEKLKPGSRIVSHDFDMQGVTYENWWTVIAKDHVEKTKDREHYVYLWKTPLQKETPKPTKR